MTVRELVATLLRLPQQMPVCLPPEPGDERFPDAFCDPHEISGTSRWDGDYLSANGRALIRGPFVQLDGEPH